jgi:gamma-glutamyltranspeptidase/glutathione hydrolase
MIVAPQPEAVEAGTRVLAEGGSAVDAVLACAFTQGVVDPMMCGIGGLGSMQVFDPKSGQHIILDGLSTVPEGGDRRDVGGHLRAGVRRRLRLCAEGRGERARPPGGDDAGHAAGVHEAAHTRFGRRDWASRLVAGDPVRRGGLDDPARMSRPCSP